MLSRRRSTDESSKYEASALDCIFACGICQATVPEVYSEGHSHGLNSGDSHQEAAVTKIWIADCSHVFCGKHLEGGGIPFHPAGVEHAKVTCPVCVDLKRDHTKRRVFWIRGLSKGQYDSVIPDKWFICPPEKLQNGDSDALRFQYCNLQRYSVQATRRWKSAEKKLRRLEKHHHQERKIWEKEQSELKAQIAALEKKEAKLEKWEKKRSMINHYLNAVTDMEREIKGMRSQLLKLGFQVPAKTYTFESDEATQPAAREPEMAKSSATFVDDKQSSSSQKRKHPQQDYYGEEDRSAEKMEKHRPMMPPPLPVKRGNKGVPSQASYDPPREVRHRRSQYFGHAAPLQALGSPSEQYAETRPPPQLQRPPESQRGLPPPSRANGQYAIQRSNQAYEQPRDGIYETFDDYGRGHPDTARGSHGQRTLPFRSTHLNGLFAQSNDGYRTREQQELSQPASLFAAPPRRPDPSEEYFLPEDEYTEQPPPSQRASKGPRIQHFEAAYGTMQQQSGGQAPRQMQGFHCDPPPGRLALSSRSQMHAGTPSQRGLNEPSTSVLSPFFQSQPKSRGPAIQQPLPPSRGSDVQLRYASDVPRAIASERSQFRQPALPTSSYGLPNRISYSRSRLPPPSGVGYQRAPRLSDYAYNPQSSAPRPPSQRNRITFPPGTTTTRIPLNDSQDPQLARIQGARGGAMPRQNYSRQGNVAAASTPARSLISAAGSHRRAVQR